MNLNIYLRPNSAHPPDVIQSIVFGSVCAYYLHNSRKDNFQNKCVTLARNLIHCGWEWGQLRSHFNDAFDLLQKQGKVNMLKRAMKTRREKNADSPAERLLVFRVPYHPRGVQRREIRKAYHDSGLENLLPDRRFICAQLRTINLRDRVCRTALECEPGATPSDFLATNPQS